MKKKITLITSILLILALAVTFVGCNKDKTEETPTTEASEKVSTTEPTTKFEAPEIKDEPTTEETTEETEASAPETTTKKATYSSSSSGSSSNSSSNKGTSSKPASKPASTTKASTSNSGGFVSAGKNEDGNEVYVNQNGVKITIDDDDVGNYAGLSDEEIKDYEDKVATDYATDPDVQEALEADKNPDAWGRG